eukprot:scaffold3907_cov36-Attheya_sp.AAC.1
MPVSNESMDAASRARAALIETVPHLPIFLSDSHMVRSFGRIKVEDTTGTSSTTTPTTSASNHNTTPSSGDIMGTTEPLFSSAGAIHPVGFSCDRYEFSPSHGRVLKMRCDILDGAVVKQQRENFKKKAELKKKKKLQAQREKKEASEKDQKDEPTEEEEDKGDAKPTEFKEDVSEELNGDKEPKIETDVVVEMEKEEEKQEEDDDPLLSYEGPVFRIMWGKGVDEDQALEQHAFDPYSLSAPLGGVVDAVAMPLSSSKDTKTSKSTKQTPQVDMRVSVRFDQNQWYGGTIRRMVQIKMPVPKDGTTVKKIPPPREKFKIRIEYDDGAKEDAYFPDPDILLRPPGFQNSAEDGQLHVTELNGKPVVSVAGKSAIEAWAKTLIKFGLVDEIMYENAMETLEGARMEGRAEVMGKIEAQKSQRQQAKQRYYQKQKDEDVKSRDDSKGAIDEDHTEKEEPVPIVVRVVDGEAVSSNMRMDSSDEEDEGNDKEPMTEEEENLRQQMKDLLEQHEEKRKQARVQSVVLADARLAAIGPFLTNPFLDIESNQSQQASWLATVIRKEKSKMGSTGNKRKIVTATDLLERNDTFFNSDIENLVEGLPGSEYCPSYVFHDFRGGGSAAASQAWVHEAQIKQEKEREKRVKALKEAKEKESQMRQKELKRKERDEERESRKRQKMEEFEEKKRQREEERLSRLSVQVDDRLFKEACFQREKVVQLMAKALGKEFARRRRAAEILSSHVVETSKSEKLVQVSPSNELFTKELPPLWKRRYDGDVLRVWDFICSFRPIFEVDAKEASRLPSLDELQDAIDVLRNKITIEDAASTIKSKEEAIERLTKLSIALCKPLAPGLLKILSSVVTPAAQSDVASTASTDEEKLKVISMPVNNLTWREVARLSFLSDALSEIGFSKQECSHMLRGYRSGGHPNSKSAKRLRRGEDFALVLLRQALSEQAEKRASDMKSNLATGKVSETQIKVRVMAPCAPSAVASDWTFYLHNVKALPPTALTASKMNLRKALALVKVSSSSKLNGVKLDSIVADLQKSLTLFERVTASQGSGERAILSASDATAVNKARLICLKVLDKVTGEIYSTDVANRSMYREINQPEASPKESVIPLKPPVHQSLRQRMGLIKSLHMSEEDYKHA